MNNLRAIGCDIKGNIIDISYPYKNNRIGIKLWGYLDYLSEQGYRITGFFKGRDYIFKRKQNPKADSKSKRSKKKSI